MRRHRLLVTLAFGSIAMVVACNAIIGLSGDYDVTPPDIITGTDARAADSPTTPPDGATADGSPTTDSGIPDTGSPDACPAENIELTIDAGAALATGLSHVACGDTDTLCWTFDGADPPPTFGWDEYDQTPDAGIELAEGDAGDPNRDLHTTIPAGSVVPSSAGLRITDWFSKTPANDPLPFPVNATITSTFHFKVRSLSDAVFVGGWKLAGQVFGLAVYPTPCGGRPRVASTFAPPHDAFGGAFIDRNVFYQATVTLTRQADNTFGGSVAVGPLGLSDAGTTLPQGNFQVITGQTDTIAIGFQVGMFNGETSNGPNEIFIDDAHAVTSP